MFHRILYESDYVQIIYGIDVADSLITFLYAQNADTYIRHYSLT